MELTTQKEHKELRKLIIKKNKTFTFKERRMTAEIIFNLFFQGGFERGVYKKLFKKDLDFIADFLVHWLSFYKKLLGEK